ncbi:unnamed protein product [Vitrella brassicaformis CCMP3155]|uniref:Uncharacterized protein n=1 Tax=Vitrella brassicaformis (strain CCMP3155) TaxID=1169540 RepID=A0A0G4ER25_VITBC|nr:unnamed protein product [Vitrella brassicaformis CCMP3155]|eukprot:CEM00021.1 unnamed protein product [Vitrella brassicaformis CCMP3155]
MSASLFRAGFWVSLLSLLTTTSGGPTKERHQSQAMKFLGLLLCVAFPVVRCHDISAGTPAGFLHTHGPINGSPLKRRITSLQGRNNKVDPDEELLFITNHRMNVPDGEESVGQAASQPTSVSFDEKNNDASGNVHFCESGTDDEHKEIFSEKFLARLRNSKAETILFSIHGFNVQPTDALDETAKIQAQFNTMAAERGDDAGRVKVVGLIWPCGDKIGIIRDYWDDRRRAYASVCGFERVLAKVLRADERMLTNQLPDPETDLLMQKNVSIMAHSMGNRVLWQTLIRADEMYPIEGIFRDIFMVAADVPNNVLDEPSSICMAADRVSVYYASDDLPLTYSLGRIPSGWRQRIGRLGPAKMDRVHKNVWEIDCSRFNNKLGGRLYGHGYHTPQVRLDDQDYPNPVLRHAWQTMIDRQVDTMGKPEEARSLVLSLLYSQKKAGQQQFERGS